MARARTQGGRRPPLQAPQTSHYSRDTRMWPSLLSLLCPGQRSPPWHCQPHVAEQEPTTQDLSRGERARPGVVCLCKSTVTVWTSGICRGGIPLLGSAHSHNTQTHGAMSGTRDTHRPCEIKKKCLRGVCVQFLLRQAPSWRVRVRHAALAKNGDGAGQGLSPFVWEDFHRSSSQLLLEFHTSEVGLFFGCAVHSSLTRDQTCTPCSGSSTRPPGESLEVLFIDPES